MPSTGMVWTVPQHRWVSWWMLFKNRKYAIEKIKKPLMKAIVTFGKDYPKHRKFLERTTIVLAKRYPEPTKDHTLLPRTYILIDTRDRFFEHFVFEDETEKRAFEAIWKTVIVEYEHDPYYCFRLNVIYQYIIKMGWDSQLPIEYNLGILIATRDKFFEHENNSGRDALFQAIWRIFIAEYKHHRTHIDWIIEEIKKSSWGSELIKTPTKCWKE